MDSTERTSANAGVKNSQSVIIIIIIIMRRTNFHGFCDTKRIPNLGNSARPSDSQQQQKWTCTIVNIAVPADHRVKLKQVEKSDKYLDLARVLKMEYEGDSDTNRN